MALAPIRTMNGMDSSMPREKPVCETLYGCPRPKHIPQKTGAAGPFPPGKRSPEGTLRAKTLPRNESGTLDGPIPPGNLRSERQKKLIQAFLGEEISHQPRSALDKEDFPGEETADRGKNRPGADCALILHFPDDDGGGKVAFADPVGALRGRNDQHFHCPGPEDGKARIDLAARGDDDVQRGVVLPQRGSQLPVRGGKRRADGLRGPEGPWFGAKRPGADDHRVGDRPQQSHDHPVVRVGTADGAPIRQAGGGKRSNAVQWGDEVANDVRPVFVRRESEGTEERRRLGGQG